eukprot:TCALIF_07783-PA protein Name:"Protein of unknown function" AED:0.13 eAED:0.13 QI:12/1/0.5/1/1/0.5/2/282/49
MVNPITFICPGSSSMSICVISNWIIIHSTTKFVCKCTLCPTTSLLLSNL